MAYRLAQVRSLAQLTDLFLHQYRGVLREREGYLVAETPDNPGFFWGNFLFFPEAPRAGDFARWEALFRKEFAHNPRIKHLTFAWDEQSPGEAAEFLAAGYEAETGSVLSLKQGGLKAPRKKMSEGSDLVVRPLESDADWEAATQNQIACRLEGWSLEAYTPFKRTQMAQYRRMVRNGKGLWWGAFTGTNELTAECGLFFSGQIGRFQNVGTSPAHRRQGICSRLVFEVCRHALAEDPSRTLVIVADEGEPADFIYRSVGFAPAGKQFTLTWWPRDEWSGQAQNP